MNLFLDSKREFVLFGWKQNFLAMNHDSFPACFEAPNPIFDDGSIGASVYISREEGLESPGKQADQIYVDFFGNIDAKLSRLADSLQIPGLVNWIRSLTGKTKLLEIHNNDFFNRNERIFSNCYIQFSDSPNFKDWQARFPSYGMSLELLDRDLSDLPAPLQEVYSLGVLWLYGIPCSGFFYHPDKIKKALEEEYLGDFISDEGYKGLNYPLDELKVFFTDSACWLMYDEAENVYCGGVECGDFYRSSKKLAEVVDNIFSQLMAGQERFPIEGFAPKAEEAQQ